MRSVLYFVIITVAVMGSFIGTTGCANIIPPSGGPRDSLPPELMIARPEDSTVGFDGDRITFYFDEYVDLQDVQKNLLFNPTFERNPAVDVKLRTITVRMRDTLEENTTYTLDFGNAIKDVNEGNVMRNFRYVFSTGRNLDTRTLKGNVVLAETGRVDSNMVAVLYTTPEDSAVFHQRPRYIARVDSKGTFQFENLPAGTFWLYAWGEAQARRYTSRSQLFAFADSPVVVRADSSTATTLFAYRETPAGTTTTTTPVSPTRPTTGRNGRGADGGENRLRFSTNLQNNTQSLLDSLVLTFEEPLRTFDSTKLSLTTDSTFTPVSYALVLDSSRRNLVLQSAWREGTLYNLVLDREFADDSAGRRLLKTDTLSFTTRKRAEYGSLNINFRNIDTTQNPVLQLVQNNTVLLSTSIQSGTFYRELMLPGDYELRILYDRNANGKWDPGQFFGVRRQPELVVPVEQKITVKANWANEFER